MFECQTSSILVQITDDMREEKEEDSPEKCLFAKLTSAMNRCRLKQDCCCCCYEVVVVAACGDVGGRELRSKEERREIERERWVECIDELTCPWQSHEKR